MAGGCLFCALAFFDRLPKLTGTAVSPYRRRVHFGVQKIHPTFSHFLENENGGLIRYVVAIKTAAMPLCCCQAIRKAIDCNGFFLLPSMAMRVIAYGILVYQFI